MSELDTGTASAAADSIAAPASTEMEAVVETPNPIKTGENPGSNPPEDKKPVSAREALEKAAAKVKDDSGKQDDAKAKAEPAAKAKELAASAEKEPVAKEAPPTSEPKSADQPTPSKYTAPERFSSDAKAAWEAVPEPAKAEVHRAIRELEQGHQKYKADAEAFSEVKEYHELAKQHGTSIKDALTRYTGLEKQLSSPDTNVKAQAIANVLRYANVSPHEYAAYVMGQNPDTARSQSEAQLRGLQQEIASLKQQLGGVTSTIHEQKSTAVLSDIEKFAQANPRFDELGETIAKLITSGMAVDLKEAYDMADRLNPGPASVATPAAPVKTNDLQAQTLRGSKSVSGAPASGSDPASKAKPSSSIRDALKRANAASG